MSIFNPGPIGNLSGGNAVTLQGKAINASEPASTDVLAWNAITSEWEPGAVPNSFNTLEVAGALTADHAAMERLAITGANTNVTLRQGLGAGGIAPNELVVQASGPNLNALVLQNTDSAGWSALTCRDAGGNEKCAFGYGNNGVSIASYLDRVYLEISDAFTLGSAPDFVLAQSTTYEGALAYGVHPRVVLYGDGVLKMHRRETGTEESDLTRILELHHTDPVLTLGAATGPQGYADIRGADANFAIVLRAGGDSGGNINQYFSYGGNRADGGGHRFFSGGMRGSQHQVLHLANDGIAAHLRFQFAPLAEPAGPEKGDTYFDSTSNKLRCWDGAAWNNLW